MCCTPPSATYKSHVFNYPASTGRITNVHAMENIRRLFFHVHRALSSCRWPFRSHEFAYA